MSEANSNRKNRRRSMRQPSKRTTRVYCHGPMGLGPNLAVKLLDLSETGVRMVVTKQMSEGTEIEVHLEGLCHRRALRRWGDVVWCIPTDDNQYCVGIALRKPIPFRMLYHM